MFTIVVDTSCDLPAEYIKEHDIEVIPIPFMLDGVEHSMGYWQEITAAEFYGALRNGGVAKTSQINPDAFVKSFTEYAKQGKEVLYIILSSGLSGTFQNALIALEKHTPTAVFIRLTV
jgi:DegV family protein with EDD domain